LHLVGYDHVNNDEAVVMESLERQVLEAKGFDNPYKNDDRNLREA
jgi:probable rRNA maturation factor